MQSAATSADRQNRLMFVRFFWRCARRYVSSLLFDDNGASNHLLSFCFRSIVYPSSLAFIKPYALLAIPYISDYPRVIQSHFLLTLMLDTAVPAFGMFAFFAPFSIFYALPFLTTLECFCFRFPFATKLALLAIIAVP